MLLIDFNLNAVCLFPDFFFGLFCLYFIHFHDKIDLLIAAKPPGGVLPHILVRWSFLLVWISFLFKQKNDSIDAMKCSKRVFTAAWFASRALYKEIYKQVWQHKYTDNFQRHFT